MGSPEGGTEKVRSSQHVGKKRQGLCGVNLKTNDYFYTWAHSGGGGGGGGGGKMWNPSPKENGQKGKKGYTYRTK